MKGRFLIQVFILASFSILSGKCYSCGDKDPTAVISGGSDPRNVCVGETENFNGTSSYDNDEGGSFIVGYQWSCPGASVASPTASSTHITFGNYGSYTVTLTVTDDESATDNETCQVYSIAVTSVNQDKTLACINEDVTFTAHANPSGKSLGCIEWQKRYRANSGDSWGDWGSASGGDNTAVLNTGTAGYYQYRARNGSEDSWKESSVVTIVEVDKIQYQNPSSSQWVDISATLYVKWKHTVKFKAVPNPSDASWPTSKPVWGGTSGASGSGSTTQVFFDGLSSSIGDYKTVTASCGNTVTTNVIIYELIAVTTPRDNFIGGSNTRYGVSEHVDLEYDIAPEGLTAIQVGGWQWSVSPADVGEIKHGDKVSDGVALYVAPLTADVDSVTLTLTLQSGPCEGAHIDCEKTIIEPDGGACVKRDGSSIWHKHNTFSIGLNSNMYLRPKDVSFKWLEFKEGTCNSQVTGWFTPRFAGTGHSAWAIWIDVGGGNSNTGCKILQDNGDFAELYWYETCCPYSSGTFLWEIPWKYKSKYDWTGTKTFTEMNQEFTVDSSEKAGVRKDSSGWFYNHHSDPSQSY